MNFGLIASVLFLIIANQELTIFIFFKSSRNEFNEFDKHLANGFRLRCLGLVC